MRTLVSACILLALAAMAPLRLSGATGTQETGRPASDDGAVVFGVVWNAENQPIAEASVRLRNIGTGRIDANDVSDDAGEFRFEQLEAGTYVVECVGRTGTVLAVGHVFSIVRGETVATFIRLSERRSWLAVLLGNATNAAAAVVSSAAALGVTALAPPPRDVTPES